MPWGCLALLYNKKETTIIGDTSAMTYIVLARKWRPIKFEEVIGQEHVTRTLMNALKQQRIAHAYIFAGPRGVGKTTTARLLAKAVNCQKQPAVNPCNECPACVSITRGNSLDVIEIDGASNRGIDEIRNLRENIRFAPASLRYKIYIIDEVHMLTKEAFNALLKTLEEPPSHAIFIFATTEIHKVPLTILSRCQRFDFKRIPNSEIAQHLLKISREEKINIDEDSLGLIARKSEGSMRDAQSILDQLISYTEGKITSDNVRESLGLINEELFFQYSELMQQKEDALILDFARSVFQSGHDLMDFLYGLEMHFRNLLVVRSTGNTKFLDTSDHFKKLYQQHAPAFPESDLLHFIDILTQSESLLKFSPNPQLILELLLLKLAHKPRALEIEELLTALSAGGAEGNPLQPAPRTPGPSGAVKPNETPAAQVKEKSKSGYSAAAPEAPSSGDPFAELSPASMPRAAEKVSRDTEPPKSGAAESTLDFSQIVEQWPAIVESVRKRKIALGSFLQDAVPYKLVGKELQLAFDTSSGFHREHVQKNARAIEEILEKQFQLPVRIKCVTLNFEQAAIKKKVHSPAEILNDIKEKEPVLKKIIELFDCEEVDEEELNET